MAETRFIPSLFAALAVLLVAGLARAADYSDDDLCWAIGKTPAVAVQPRDRLFFEKRCACFGHDLGCAAKGSEKAGLLGRVDQEMANEEKKTKAEAKAKADRQRAEAKARAERRRAKEEASERASPLGVAREAYRICLADPQRTECSAEESRISEALRAKNP